MYYRTLTARDRLAPAPRFCSTLPKKVPTRCFPMGSHCASFEVITPTALTVINLKTMFDLESAIRDGLLVKSIPIELEDAYFEFEPRAKRAIKTLASCVEDHLKSSSPPFFQRYCISENGS
ncbi:hypothetical protein EVAR_3959_1 [Eumeta japonica]|uniref:Uncharacterized protein n=1 Tax=Eumeta variegata TaxID=151549 RepID=A0A4C1STU0_EUMVA|nr:hypothetical protein EVAR_3959_1 [Eumeta japonica]